MYDDQGRLRQTIPGPAVQAIVTKFVKVLDPTSVARESEVEGAQQSIGLYNYLVQTAQQMGRGRVSAEDMLPFLEAANQLGDISMRVWQRRTEPLRRASQELLSEQGRQYVYGLTPGFDASSSTPPAPKVSPDVLRYVPGAQ